VLFEGFETIRRFFVVLFIGLVAAFFAVVFLQQIERYGRKTPEPVTLSGVYLRVVKEGSRSVSPEGKIRTELIPRWEARSGKVVVSPDGKKYELDSIGEGVYYRKDKPPFFFEAGGGGYDTETENMSVDDGIQMYSENGDFFKSKSAQWNGKENRLRIPTPVVFRMDWNTYEGGEMEAWGENLSNFSVRDGVKVKIEDLKSSLSDEDKKDLEDENPDGEYTKNLFVTAALVEYEDTDEVLRCYSQDDSRTIFIPGLPAAGPEQFVTLQGNNFFMKAKEIYIDKKNKFAHVVGRVRIVREPEKTPEGESRAAKVLLKRETIFETEEAYYFWKDHYIDVPISVTMYKKDARAKAGRMHIDTKADTAFLSGGVKLFQDKSDWLIKDGAVKKDASDEVKDAAREKTDVSSDNMDIDFENDNIKAYGNVTAVQKKRRMQGGYAAYDDGAETWTLSGAPYVEEGDYAVNAGEFVYKTGDGLVEATGGVMALIGLKDEDRADAMEYFRERDGQEPDKETIKDKKTSVNADRVRYDESEDTQDAFGNAALKYLDVTVTADEIHNDNESRTATGKGNVVFDDPRNHATADSFTIDLKNKKIHLEGGVHLKDRGRPADEKNEKQDPFELAAKKLDYDWGNKNGVADGEVVATAESRRGSADRLVFDRKSKTYQFSGSVSLHQDNGDWFKDRDVFDENDEKARRLAGKPTDITCKQAFLDDDRNIALLDGDVSIEQQGRRIRARKVSIDSKKKVFEAAGDVYMSQDSGDWLFEEKMIDEKLEPEDEARLRRPIKITADLLVSSYGEDRIYIEGGVRAVEGKSSATADRVWHYGESKRTILEGAVNVKDEKGRELNAENIVYDRKNNTVEAFRSINGVTDLKEIEEKNK
jgi:lipopolysaccharide export system protein LptA